MTQLFVPSQLDVRVFAQSSGQLSGRDALSHYARIVQECDGRGGDASVEWSARGEIRIDHLGQAQSWLHLHADATVPLTCQRCLEGVDVRLLVDRSFRFVADEATAVAQDDEVQEDLLVLAGDFDLQQLVEDELVLELPLIARHDLCPAQLPLTPLDPDVVTPAPDRPNPFAALARLKSDRGSSSS